MSNNEQKFLAIFLSFLFIFLIFVISFVFSGRLILPQTFSLGPLTIHFYGLIMALAVASGFYLAKKRAENFGIDSKKADDIIFWIIIGGFIGARLYHVLSSFGYYQHDLLNAFKVWNGGLSIYGAILGGLIVLLIYGKVHNYPRPPLILRGGAMDWLTPSLILGQIIGRFGNLFNYEAFGYPTNLPWKMFVPSGFRPGTDLDFEYFHPWFLYEQIGLIAVFWIIGKIRKSDQSGNRYLFIWYLLLYNGLRFGLEFLRIDSTFIGSFRLNSVVSLVLVFASLLIIFRLNEQK